MNILVIEDVYMPEDKHPCWEVMRRAGHTVTLGPSTLYFNFAPDTILCMSVTKMEETRRALMKWPNATLYCYNWDTYEWVWTNPRKGEYDYTAYGELMKGAKEVWVPSVCTRRRCEQWWPELTGKVQVILSACPWWEYPTTTCKMCNGNGAYTVHSGGPEGEEYVKCDECNGRGATRGVRDDGYALMCMREIPDPWWGVFERCCEELGIPYRSTRHELSEKDYRDAVACCRFICCPLYECSTGGLSLMEAHYHGKPVLLSDSEWNGGVDYMGSRAMYFKHGDEKDFKVHLRWLSSDTSFLDPEPCSKWVRENYSDERMGRDILRRLEA